MSVASTQMSPIVFFGGGRNEDVREIYGVYTFPSALLSLEAVHIRALRGRLYTGLFL